MQFIAMSNYIVFWCVATIFPHVGTIWGPNKRVFRFWADNRPILSKYTQFKDYIKYYSVILVIIGSFRPPSAKRNQYLSTMTYEKI